MGNNLTSTMSCWPGMSASLPTRYPSLLGDRVFDDFFKSVRQELGSLTKQTTQGYPVADIYTNDDGATVLEFALAGFSREDLEIDVKPEKQTITVRAKGVKEDTLGGRRIARRAFEKVYVNYNNNLDLTAASATFENGLLSVTVPQRPEVKPVSIKIE